MKSNDRDKIRKNKLQKKKNKIVANQKNKEHII